MDRIRFGVFDHIEHLPGVSLTQLYAERLTQLEALDEAGFFAYHLAEHHTPAVHSMAPSQNVFLSSAAQRTKRLRFGPGVYVLPLHHPLRLIEEVSMLDHLSGGRLEIGVGRGGVLEAYFWGQEGDEAANARRYEEVLGALRTGLANDELTYQGQYFNFDRVPMRLRPLQQPSPPFWYMRNPETAAQNGMNCIVVGSLDTLEANVVRYHRIWDAHNPPLTPQGRPPMIGLVVHTLLAEDEATAIAEAEPAAKAYGYNLGAPRRLEAERRGLTQFTQRADSGAPQRGGPDRHRAVEERRDLDASLQALAKEEREQRDARRRTPGGIPGFVVGTPETVLGYFEEYLKTGADYMVLSFQWGSLSHAQAMRSIRLFREHLAPRFALADPFDFTMPTPAMAGANP
ncbi:MAG TPA: LLM class flavin-dependent oxidoreductase [Caulobacteraceae bacterium]|jgi:alkanesulfonate monooxygenase SsuD/methylene tetrahydromethanopterin reductase-like flavin-dependent oxidoreductase (luciferase family)|nr:LLM class flavin-dependent oxidoreductase [Caulobacteraceae bacterium]